MIPKFICVDGRNQCAEGMSLQEAFDNFKDEVDDGADVDDVHFYEVSRQVKVEQKVIEVVGVQEVKGK